MSDFSYFDLDETQLDKAWLDQARHFLEASLAVADRRADCDRAKALIDSVTAEVCLEIRKSPDEFDLDKATDKGVEAAATCNVRVKKAQEKYIVAKHALDRAVAVVNALEHRKRALENLVSLFGMNYYADPKARTKEDREEMERRATVRNRGAVGRKYDKGQP